MSDMQNKIQALEKASAKYVTLREGSHEIAEKLMAQNEVLMSPEVTCFDRRRLRTARDMTPDEKHRSLPFRQPYSHGTDRYDQRYAIYRKRLRMASIHCFKFAVRRRRLLVGRQDVHGVRQKRPISSGGLCEMCRLWVEIL